MQKAHKILKIIYSFNMKIVTSSQDAEWTLFFLFFLKKRN